MEKRDLFLQLVAAPLALHGHRFINLTSTAPYSRRYKGCCRIRRPNGHAVAGAKLCLMSGGAFNLAVKTDRCR